MKNPDAAIAIGGHIYWGLGGKEQPSAFEPAKWLKDRAAEHDCLIAEVMTAARVKMVVFKGKMLLKYKVIFLLTL